MNIIEYCNCFYNFHRIPIYYYEKGQCLYKTGSYPEEVEVPRSIAARLLGGQEELDICESAVASWYGKVRIRESGGMLLIGPVKEEEYSEQDFCRFCFSYQISREKRPAYQMQFQAIPPCSLLRFRYLIRSLQVLLGEEGDSLEIYENVSSDGAEDKKAEQERHKQREFGEGSGINLKEQCRIFRPLLQGGDLEKMTEQVNRDCEFSFGEYSGNKRENRLVIMIMSIALTMDAAMEGGMPEAETYLLAKHYISKALKEEGAEKIDRISMQAVVAFAERMRLYQNQGVSHTTILECMQFVRSKVYAPVSVQDVAAYAGYSEEYFSKLFKKETGFGAGEFIYNCKLLEAETLLKNTALSVGEISEALCFSNQSHFQHRFKKKYGMTPGQYRNRKKSHE